MDAIDRKILTVLQSDADVSLSNISKQVALSTTPCWKRIQKLEKAGILLNRVAVVDPEKVGLGLTVFVQIETRDHSGPWLERFARSVTAMPEVMGFYRMAGEVDYMLQVVVADREAYDTFYLKLTETVRLKKVTSRFATTRIKSTTVYKVPELPRA